MKKKRTETFSTLQNEPPTIKTLFDETKKGNLNQIIQLLHLDSKRLNVQMLMCHPLCDCQKCSKVIGKKKISSNKSLTMIN